MKSNLRERYIYAVTRHLPGKIQPDVEKELDGLISDMLDERCGGGEPSEQDIKDVLTELGSPEELALKYSGDERRALISGTYYLIYKRVLRLVLPIVAAVVAVLSILGLILGLESMEGSLRLNLLFIYISSEANSILQVIANPISAVVQAFMVITVVFAVLDYKKVQLQESDMFLGLPDLPEAKMRIKPWESIFEIALCVVAVIVFLGFPQIMFASSPETGRVPVFDIAVLRSLWLPIVLWGIAGISEGIVQLIEGQYTVRLAKVSVAAGALAAVCVVIVFGRSDIMNPAFLDFLQVTFVGEGSRWIGQALAHVNLIVLAAMLIGIAIETVSTVVKAFQARRT